MVFPSMRKARGQGDSQCNAVLEAVQGRPPGSVNTHLPDVGVGPKQCEENMPFTPPPTSLLGCWISLVEAIERI